MRACVAHVLVSTVSPTCCYVDGLSDAQLLESSALHEIVRGLSLAPGAQEKGTNNEGGGLSGTE